MGQKVHPVGIRLGITRDWNARWYADSKNYSDFLISDVEIRKELHEKLKHASVSQINIERVANGVRVTVHTARPGVVIGKKGEDIEKLKQALIAKTGLPVNINIEEIKKPELDAKLVAESIAQQLEKRIQFRRAMKRAVSNAMRLGAEGIKVNVSGRLNGAEIARAEWYREGRVPLHTLRADIDYATFEADTTYGKIGVKVWIFKGEKLEKISMVNDDKKQSKGKKGRK
ncbi:MULTISPECIES: 30S ribosomal protein S3 [Piscirickettsiaceae]|jgi:small subunit ribosomal protein S3|uniref:Small ribosomal subunit protein uS3 n=1 Tax=Hydrogenovibrio thermophilus TaxID=265883 RepID=A0A451G4W5_9GAMM|nr:MULTISPECIES: 30S ribosomal protein S3 [Piscirickettsiaceae]AZR82879.1 30S ribosomal protein S3 [Thiomicrospira sp. S5]QAB14529.1 30S ribosomal protein S3 [Hydrogenovibrio thermophilus]